MLLESLSICNYGVYAGKNDFELSTTPEKPIMVVGGMNGAGKTTILESMMIALYGKTYFGSKRSNKEYLYFIYNKIHRSNKKREESASIELAFRFYHNNAEDRYVINRSWDVEGASVHESFTVQKNGQMMNDIDESQWQSFIESLIPFGIARLFFFDGEKIVRIAENKGKNNSEIKESIDTLIGADLIRRLHADLDLYKVRKSDSGNDLTSQYEEAKKELEQMMSDIQSLIEEKEQKTNDIAEVNAKIVLKESSISGIGGGYADIRGQLLAKKAVLEEKIRSNSKTIHEELASNVPLYLSSALLQRIRKQIRKDSETFLKCTVSIGAGFVTDELKKRLDDNPKFWPQNVNGKQLTESIIKELEDIGKPVDLKSFFDLTPDDTELLTGVMKDIKNGKKSFLNLINSYAELATELDDIDLHIARIPKDDELGPYVSELNQMHQELGLLNGEIAHIDQQIASKKSYSKILRSRVKTMINDTYKDKSATSGVKLASKMQSVLDTYYLRLKERKMKELESNLLDTARLLLHKESIHKIEIDRNTFEIKVYENDQIPGDFLSMGEKQIVGTALLWAIARTCRRSLPFVIDTPLGRLDRQHVLNLVDKFYPVASHQVILLSTDREIGHEEYDKLYPHISNSYQIICDKAKSVTSIAQGYFEEEQLAQT